MSLPTVVVNLAQELKVKPQHTLRFLTTPLGAFVKTGHLLAHKKGFLRSVKVFSPTDGVLEKLNEETGELTIKGEKVKQDEKAGGEMDERVEKHSQSFKGFGKNTEGELVNLNKELTSEILEREFSGKVLIVSGLPSSEAIFKANALGVAGIIVPRELTVEELEIKDRIYGKVSLGLLAKELDFRRFIGKRVRLDGEKGEVNLITK